MEEEKGSSASPGKKPEKIKDLEKLTTTKLRELALERYPQIKGVHGMKKEELVEAIKAVEIELGIREKEEPKRAARRDISGKVRREKKLLSLAEAKAAVRRLKQERQGALESKDRKLLREVREKIKALKRHMRKLREAS
jgi:hypothetical protein